MNQPLARSLFHLIDVGRTFAIEIRRENSVAGIFRLGNSVALAVQKRLDDRIELGFVQHHAAVELHDCSALLVELVGIQGIGHKSIVLRAEKHTEEGGMSYYQQLRATEARLHEVAVGCATAEQERDAKESELVALRRELQALKDQEPTALTAYDADMVWPDDSDEMFFHTIDDAVENEVNNAWPVDVEPPANGELELKVQLAKRIPAVTIRIFNITENGHEWEIVTAMQQVRPAGGDA